MSKSVSLKFQKKGNDSDESDSSLSRILLHPEEFDNLDLQKRLKANGYNNN